MTNCLIIGHGAREHAIGEALAKAGVDLYAFMSFKNAGLDELSNNRIIIHSETDFEEIINFCKNNKIDFVVIGPEDPLCKGIVNRLEDNGIPCVGPKIEAAKIEGSKIFMRELLEKYNIKSNIKSKKFNSLDGVEEYIDSNGEETIVVKPDGLTGGKGVKVYGDHLFSKEDILTYCEEIIKNNDNFILEEKIDGEEFTLQTFVDGKNVIGTPLVQDHKRAFENDDGPNTGGMGSYSIEDHLLPFITKDDINDALNDMKEVVNAIRIETGVKYKGFLYGQFIKTSNGIKIIEFNARLGDPEAMNILPLLKTNFLDICKGIINENLNFTIEFEKKATVCKYLAPEGYPISPKKDELVEINDKEISKIGARYYYASVYKKGENIFTTSSRAMGVLGISNSLEEAENIAEKAVGFIKGKLFHRKDIGTRSLLQKRINHMSSLQN
ncbi:MAG: phosphoribosylamine--glycine ligase [Candidatus Lokiarchaeota archaeon]|nr:phosphoribosylamine--glycine ligase [Candidatus Lokiarchaeota archaeon]